jgi:hypothetical protein
VSVSVDFHQPTVMVEIGLPARTVRKVEGITAAKLETITAIQCDIRRGKQLALGHARLLIPPVDSQPIIQIYFNAPNYFSSFYRQLSMQLSNNWHPPTPGNCPRNVDSDRHSVS